MKKKIWMVQVAAGPNESYTVLASSIEVAIRKGQRLARRDGWKGANAEVVSAHLEAEAEP